MLLAQIFTVNIKLSKETRHMEHTGRVCGYCVRSMSGFHLQQLVRYSIVDVFHRIVFTTTFEYIILLMLSNVSSFLHTGTLLQAVFDKILSGISIYSHIDVFHGIFWLTQNDCILKLHWKRSPEWMLFPEFFPKFFRITIWNYPGAVASE